MKILISACLLGQNCKYNGFHNKNDALIRWLADNGHEAVPICPEIFGGLASPRTPCEIVDGTVMNRDGENVDFEFRRGAEIALKTALNEGVTLAILQPRSPSCGKGIIYDGSFSGRKKEGNGVFAELLTNHGIDIVNFGEL